MDRADQNAATIRNASRTVRRMASSRAKVNYSFASFLPVCDIGEGQLPWSTNSIVRALTDAIRLAWDFASGCGQMRVSMVLSSSTSPSPAEKRVSGFTISTPLR